jgi:hypothetical protein
MKTKLQYQLSNGDWVDCARADGDTTERFLLLCEKTLKLHHGVGPIATRAEVLAALAAGEKIQIGPDWYSTCRDGAVIAARDAARRAARPPVELVKCACGHTVPRGSVMSASLGSACPDCYDRLSN